MSGAVMGTHAARQLKPPDVSSTVRAVGFKTASAAWRRKRHVEARVNYHGT